MLLGCTGKGFLFVPQNTIAQCSTITLTVYNEEEEEEEGKKPLWSHITV